MEGPSIMSVSLCMIVKNEEATIGRCLASVRDVVQEIIIVDTGSSDHTKDVVRQYTDKIYDFAWIDDFAAARNYSFSLATKEYILWLDADDVLESNDHDNLLTLLESMDNTIDAVSMLYNLSRDDQGNVVTQIRRNRLVKRKNNCIWIGNVHEYLEVYGHVLQSDVAITHDPIEHDSDRNLRIYEQRLLKGETFTPRDLYYFANELLDHKLYNRAIEYYHRFLATNKGWIEDIISTCGKLADCYYFLNDIENQLKYIFKSFEYDVPRAEFCCRLGYHYLNSGDFKRSIFWYKLVPSLEEPNDSWGLISHACWTWIPHIQLCVCYSKIGKYELACYHNEIAAKYLGNDSRVVQNREFLKNVLTNSEK